MKIYKDPFEPAIFYGMYQKDVTVLEKHKGLAIVIWRGSDILKKKRLRLAIKKRAKHIAISSFITKDLKKAGVPYKFIPITGVDYSKFKPFVLGNEIYVYALKSRFDFYGGKIISKIKKRCKYKVNLVKESNMYSRKELFKIYSRCFCGLRLTPHDGVANTVIELGLMGRKCIYNGDTPNAIPWNRKNIDEILENINIESKKVGKTDFSTSSKVKKYISVGEDWLDTGYWD